MNRQEILDEAKRLVITDRAKTHGPAEDSFGAIARYWSVYLKREITSYDAAMMMTLFKIARMEHNPNHQDSPTDGCGYLAIAGELSQTLQKSSSQASHSQDHEP